MHRKQLQELAKIFYEHRKGARDAAEMLMLDDLETSVIAFIEKNNKLFDKHKFIVASGRIDRAGNVRYRN